MSAEQNDPETHNGLTEAQSRTIADLKAAVLNLVDIIRQDLPSHRSLSLAITKLEEAKHWLEDRKKKPPERPRQP